MLPEMNSEKHMNDTNSGRILVPEKLPCTEQVDNLSVESTSTVGDEAVVSFELTGDLAKRWVKQRGSMDDKSFIRLLLDGYKSIGPELMDQLCDDKSSISKVLMKTSHRDNAPKPSTQTGFDGKEDCNNPATLLKVEIDQSEYNINDDENLDDVLMENCSRDSNSSDSNFVEILVNKSDNMICEFCHQKITGETKRYHVFSEHFTLYARCDLCESKERLIDKVEKNVVHIDKYLHHRSSIHGDSSGSCPFCDQLVKPSSFSEHLINAHWKNLFCLCKVCVANSNTQNQPMLKGVSIAGHILKKHSKWNPEKVACQTCGVVVFQLNMAKHIKSVHENARQVCEVCGKSVSDVIRHRKRIHEDSQFKFQCETCGKKLTSKWNLTVHNRLHTGEKPFVCETCGKSFHQKVELRLHNRNNHENSDKVKIAKKEVTVKKSKPIKNQCENNLLVENGLSRQNVLQTIVSQSSLSTSNVYVITSQPVTSICSATCDSNNGQTVNLVKASSVDPANPQVLWLPVTQISSSAGNSVE